jgi:hypothetical protein
MADLTRVDPVVIRRGRQAGEAMGAADGCTNIPGADGCFAPSLAASHTPDTRGRRCASPQNVRDDASARLDPTRAARSRLAEEPSCAGHNQAKRIGLLALMPCLPACLSTA